MRIAGVNVKRIIIAGLCTLTVASVALCVWTGSRGQGKLYELVAVDALNLDVAHVQCCLMVTLWSEPPPPPPYPQRNAHLSVSLPRFKPEGPVRRTRQILHGISIHNRGLTTFAFDTTGNTYELRFPTWVLIVIFGAYPIAVLVRSLRARSRISKSCCPVCRYDLRATPCHCPECGWRAVTVGAK